MKKRDPWNHPVLGELDPNDPREKWHIDNPPLDTRALPKMTRKELRAELLRINELYKQMANLAYDCLSRLDTLQEVNCLINNNLPGEWAGLLTSDVEEVERDFFNTVSTKKEN